MFGQSLLSAFGIACTTDTDQLFGTDVTATSTATYQLNNATTSIPSNTYPGTANNITYTSGKFGNAAVFNGSNADIDISSSAINTTSSYTISMWLNIVDVTQYEGIFANVTSSYLTNQIAFVLNNGKISIYSVVSNGNTTLDSITATPQSAIANNTWFNLVIVADRSLANKAKVFFNGVEASYVYQSGVAGTSSYSNIKVGLADGANRYFTGSIDQIRFFNSSLPQSAVTALYNETTTTAASASIDYVDANPNSIAYYKMSSATDQLGNYNGTATDVNFNTEGKFGFAGAFNGSSSVINLGTSSSFSVGTTGSLSLSLWVKTTATSTGYLMSKANDSTTQYEWALEYNGSQLQLNVFNTAQGVACGSGYNTTNINDGNWHHVSGVIINNTSVSLYIDNGNPITSTSWSGTTAGPFTIPTLIGHFGGIPASTSYWEGDVDQVRVYDSALSAANVSTLYKEVECEPVAINALANFNTVLYTGNGGTQAVTGVGFQPSLSWAKGRNGAPESHVLVDSIRGAHYSLTPNSTGSEYYNSTYQFNSFDSNGFTVTDNTAGNYGVNGNGIDYVSWNWKAPLANLSTSFNSNRQGQITLPNSITTPWYTSSEFGISCWINPSTWGPAGAQQTQAFGFTGPYSGNIGFDKEPSGNFRCFVTTSGGSFVGVNSSNNLSATNKWYHIVWTGSASAGVKLYVDGVNTGSASWDGTYLNNTGTNSIGLSPQSLRGNIAQFRVYSSYLTSSEVSDLYTEPAASNNTLNYPAGAGCIAAYPLQTDAVDLSGNYSGASSNVTFGQPGYLTSNTDGTIPSTVAANPEAGFSIVKYIGSTGNTSFGTGLTSEAEFIIFKRYTSSQNWFVFVKINNVWHYIEGLNTTSAAINYSSSMSATSTTVTLPSLAEFNQDTSSSYIAYCFTSISGYSKVGSYIGTGASGNVQYLGFEPGFILVKRTDSSGGWFLIDDKRNTSNPRNTSLEAQGNYLDNTLSSVSFDFDANSLEVNGTNAQINTNGGKYIFLAIA